MEFMSITPIWKRCAWCNDMYCQDLHPEDSDYTFCSKKCRKEWEDGLDKPKLEGQYVDADGVSHDD